SCTSAMTFRTSRQCCTLESPRHRKMLLWKCARRRNGSSPAAAERAPFAKRSNASCASAVTGNRSSRTSRVGNLKRRARRGRVIGLGLNALSFIARPLPLSFVRAIGVVLGHVAWHVLPRYRRRALDNIAVAFPEWSLRKRRDTIRRMFHHLGASLM